MSRFGLVVFGGLVARPGSSSWIHERLATYLYLYLKLTLGLGLLQHDGCAWLGFGNIKGEGPLASLGPVRPGYQQLQVSTITMRFQTLLTVVGLGSLPLGQAISGKSYTGWDWQVPPPLPLHRRVLTVCAQL